MLNINILREKYSKFVPVDNVDNFIKDTETIKNSKHIKNLKHYIPALVYEVNKRDALFFTLGIMFSLEKGRVLDYTVITGQTFSREHFADKGDKDIELNNLIYSNDILFISLSEFDYTTQYLESLIVDLIEFRKDRNLITVIHFDIVNNNNYANTTKILKQYFESNKYQVIHMSTSSTKQSTPVVKAVKKGKGNRFI